MIAKMTAIILAGGKSNRFGSDKAFVKIDGIPLIKRQLNVLRGIFKKIIIVTNRPHKYGFKNIKIIQDIIKNCGPLAGIYSGLMESGSFYNFVLSCDMPFINEALIRYIIKNCDSYDVIIPKVSRKFHPLFGVYSKNCIPVIEEMIRGGRLKISNIFPRLNTRFILKREIERFDKKSLSLVNINTKADLAKAKELFFLKCRYPK